MRLLRHMAVPVSVLDSEAVSLAVKLLKTGRVIAVPTDTVYGFACSATDLSAVDELYSIKCRNENKPVAICLGDVGEVREWAHVGHLPKGLLSSLLPGPVTVILRCRGVLDKSVVSYGKIGIRIPDYSFITTVVSNLKSPIALTSANLSSEPSSVSVEEFRHLWGKVSAVFDGGSVGTSREASTVVDLSDKGFYNIVRPGVAVTKTTEILNAFHLQTQQNAVKEIQLFEVEENLSPDISEAENTLCTVIEAIFLHGLKDSLAHRFRKAIADIDAKPEPSFWPPLLIISHKHVINQINNLTQIHTEIGQCRAWIRIVFNDCLLSSYLKSIQNDSSSLKPYYDTDAYLRDADVLDVAHRLIEGLEASKSFALPCNSSLLNTWPLPSLLLAGIWTPTLRSCPIAAGVDVAECLQSSSSVHSDACSVVSVASTNNSVIGSILNEDEALRIILGKGATTVETAGQETSSSSPLEVESSDELVECGLGNQLGKKSGWSSDEVAPGTERSFNSLIQSYNAVGGVLVKTPGVKDVWQSLEEKLNLSGNSKLSECKSESSENVTESLAAYAVKVASEKGLDAQNFECKGCQKTLSVYHKPNVCNFSGDYFCTECMSCEPHVIPALVIYNWDFRQHPVSQRSSDYIVEISGDPVIDFKVLNPQIYSVSDEMAHLLTLRSKLNFLRAYLYTCQEPVIEQLKTMMSAREYMYQHIHQYSVSDLPQIFDGTLAKLLAQVVQFGKQHVYDCWLCSQKGFICEVCNKSKPVFPFNVEDTFRCDACSAVYHKGCLDATRPCPKCERRRKREDLPLLGATMD